jgi:uncharacterized protein (DUF2132 family)
VNSKISGLGSGAILTGMVKMDDSFSWDGMTEALNVNWTVNEPSVGDCATYSMSFMKSTSCDSANNFMCEAKPDSNIQEQ